MPVDFRFVVAAICFAWLLIVFASLSHRRLLFEDAKKIVSPDLKYVREILTAANLSGEAHRMEKIEAAIKCLDSLIVRD